MLIIRLQRIGKKKQPQFRIVLAEKRRHVSKKIVEILGNYNPRNKDFSIKNEEKLKYWLDQKVEVSPTVYNLLIEKEIIKGDKKQAWKPKPKEKGEEEKPKEETGQKKDTKEEVEPVTEESSKDEKVAEDSKEEEKESAKPAEEAKEEEVAKEETEEKQDTKEEVAKEEEEKEEQLKD